MRRLKMQERSGLMPRVSEEYKQEVKQRILLAAAEVCREKPAYMITMRDVIRQVGLSPGAVYSYYPNIDSLWLDYLNGLLADHSVQENDSDLLFNGLCRFDGESVTDYLDRCFVYIERIFASLSLDRAKIIYELEIKRASDPIFAQERREKVHPVEIYKHLLEQMAQALSEGENTAAMYIFLKSWFEGFAKNLIESRCYGSGDHKVDVGQQIQVIKSILGGTSNV